MDLVIRTAEPTSPALQEVEVVERKGLGHPDTICDAIAEHLCVRLCRYNLEHFGLILHHNVDKVLLCGGAARTAFGGGEVVEPIELYVAGRATQDYLGERIPVHEIAVEACLEWFREHLRELDVERHVRIIARLRPGSADLTRVFARGEATPLANDTSVGAGFAPLTALERVVLEVEVTINAADLASPSSVGDVFLTVTGTSAEAGDDGEVGRGNRTCWLITPYRSITLEAAAGKNPVSHVGKLYNLVASRISAAITAEIREVPDAACVLVSQIGRPVADPQVVDVRLAANLPLNAGTLQGQVGNIVRSELGRLDELRDALIEERIPVY